MAQSHGVMERALSAAFRTATFLPEDDAIKALARRLAQLIDLAKGEARTPHLVLAAGRAGKLAAEYRQALAQLCLTPAARAAASKGKTPDKPLKIKSPLQEQRDAAREARERRRA